ncbi:MAG TPA: hypothetical protein PK668_12850 [Myxococcota bacterium]|nr:hypothetical protein [Myxococcota bacterium]HRY93641.1 hypothetical protein [Myxococcota bacterium]HSA23953.1 hypothetical protein [Myxococcota bacterium]
MSSSRLWTNTPRALAALLLAGLTPIASGGLAAEPPAAKPVSAWQARCAQRLEAASQEAAKLERAFAGARVQVEVLEAADGVTRELVKVVLSPPSHAVPAFSIRIARLSGQAALGSGDPGWQLRAESLQGRYHALFRRVVPGHEASVSFDGWASPRVEQLAPVFKRAADACLDLPASPSAAGALRDPRRFDCRTDADCLNSCAWGAVAFAWYARAEGLPGFSECEDGCSNQVSAPPRCEAGGCVAYQRDPRDETRISPRPACTRVEP